VNLSVASRKEGEDGSGVLLQTEAGRSVDLAVPERIRVESLRNVDAVVRAERADFAFRRRDRGSDVVLDVDREFLLVLIFRPSRAATGQIDSAQSFRTEEIGTVLVRGAGDHSKQRGPFSSLGEQLQSIRHACTPGSHRIDPRLNLLQMRAAAGGRESVNADGGFLIQPDFSRKLLKRAYETGEILQRCTEMPIAPNSNTLKLPPIDESSRANGSRMGGVSVWWENEGDQIATTTKPKLMNVELMAEKLFGLLYLTSELAQDSNVDALDSWARYAFSQELTFRLENAIVSGAGDGQPLGVLNSPALVTIAAEGGQGSGTVVSANVNKLLGGLWAKSFNRPGTVWLYNQALLPQLSTLATIVGTGGSESKLWQWATSDDDYDRLAGFPRS